MNGTELVAILAIVGALIWKAVDFLRTLVETDLHWKVPSEWWAIVAFGLSIAVGLIACNSDTLAAFVGVARGPGCVDGVLAGLGFGAAATIWQKIFAALGGSQNVGVPKGITKS